MAGADAAVKLDIIDGGHLVAGLTTKVITCVDDHSRYCVICAIVPRATGRAVCLALVAAFSRYGIPDELLTGNGKQFTARFNAGGGETMFDRTCREIGITYHLTKPRTPTTTGKIERFHQTLQNEFLNDRQPFASLAEAQAAVDAFVAEYNTTGHTSRWTWTSRPTGSSHDRSTSSACACRQRCAAERTAPVVPEPPVLPLPRPPLEEPIVMSANGIDPVNLAVQIERNGRMRHAESGLMCPVVADVRAPLNWRYRSSAPAGLSPGNRR
jgi:Integrase core domain